MEKYIDPSELYAEYQPSWTEYWDNSLSLYQNVFNITSQAVVIPNQSLLLPLACSYMLVPSKWAKVLPVLFSFGAKGSGKSTFAMLANRLHGFKQTLSPADTFASIRNRLDDMRWFDRTVRDYEKEGALMCWDNVSARTLIEDQRIYQMFLFGYNRSSEVISIAGQEGQNYSFYVFCPKIISSVEPIHAMVEFSELHRRLMVIYHKPWETFTVAEKAHLSEDFSITVNRLDIDSVCWDGIEKKFFQFWSDRENCQAYVHYRSMLSRGKKLGLSSRVKGENWTISIDLLVTGLVTGCFSSISDAIEHINAYWEFAHNRLEEGRTAVHQLIEGYISIVTAGQRRSNQLNELAGIPSIPLVIDPLKFKQELDKWQREGRFDMNLDTRLRTQIMRELGWRLTSDGWVEIN